MDVGGPVEKWNMGLRMALARLNVSTIRSTKVLHRAENIGKCGFEDVKSREPALLTLRTDA